METFFLACFAFGLLFTLASVVLGFVGVGIGHGGGHVGHLPHLSHDAHVAAHAPHAAGQGHTAHEASPGNSLPLLNASSMVGAVTLFGATGYVLTRLGDWAVSAAILGALAMGALGWYLIARFLGLILQGEVEMDPDDYRLVGTVGRVSVRIPAGGTGEVLFEKGGSRRGEAARAVGGEAIPRGSEVVITAYADGFATVQPWGEFLAEHDRRLQESAQASAQQGEA
jgi:membrane protein implicated in regulation of membrane protease activity